MKGQEEVHIRAPLVISNAGIFNTYKELLPRELQALPGKFLFFTPNVYRGDEMRLALTHAAPSLLQTSRSS